MQPYAACRFSGLSVMGAICLHLQVSHAESYYCIQCSYAGFLNDQLSSTMLVGIEVAVEYWLALSHSPQAQWLRYSDPSGCLLVRVAASCSRCLVTSCAVACTPHLPSRPATTPSRMQMYVHTRLCVFGICS